jgi:hypothetical protein
MAPVGADLIVSMGLSATLLPQLAKLPKDSVISTNETDFLNIILNFTPQTTSKLYVIEVV